MTNYIHGQSVQAKLANLHIENRDLRDALTAALNDRNQWRELFYSAQAKAARTEVTKHGKTTGYKYGCRCELCSAAQAEAGRRAYQKRKKKQP